MTPPLPVKPVTLTDDDLAPNGRGALPGGEWKALPAADFDAREARLATAESDRDAMAALLTDAYDMLGLAPAGTFCPDTYAPLMNRIRAAIARKA